jgi:hypothetical protein
MDGWMDGWMVEWLDGWLDGCLDGWLDSWKDSWMVVVPDGPSSLHLVVLHQVLHVKVFVAAQHAPAKKKTFRHFNTCVKTTSQNSN